VKPPAMDSARFGSIHPGGSRKGLAWTQEGTGRWPVRRKKGLIRAERPVLCPVCGRGFQKESHMREHAQAKGHSVVD
jgi:hypothetical protein